MWSDAIRFGEEGGGLAGNVAMWVYMGSGKESTWAEVATGDGP